MPGNNSSDVNRPIYPKFIALETYEYTDGILKWTIEDLDWHTDLVKLRHVTVHEGHGILQVIEDDESLSELTLHPGLEFVFYPRQLHRVVGGPVTLNVESL